MVFVAVEGGLAEEVALDGGDELLLFEELNHEVSVDGILTSIL